MEHIQKLVALERYLGLPPPQKKTLHICVCWQVLCGKLGHMTSEHLPGSATPPGSFQCLILRFLSHFSCTTRTSFLSFITHPATPEVQRVTETSFTVKNSTNNAVIQHVLQVKALKCKASVPYASVVHVSRSSTVTAAALLSGCRTRDCCHVHTQ